MAEQSSLESEARRRNVRVVREQLAELELVDAALADAEARIPAIRGRVRRAMDEIGGVLPPEGEEVEDG